MTQTDIFDMAKQAGFPTNYNDTTLLRGKEIQVFAKLVAAKEREALEVELLKLKQGVAANSDYIQGRWDLIGEFQDIIRLRG